MTIKTILNGSVVGTDQGNAINAAFKLNILNTIRTLQDRTITFSAGQQDVFAEAYNDSNGRLDSVLASTALFSTDKYGAQYSLGTIETQNPTASNSSASSNLTVTCVVTGKGYFSSIIFDTTNAGGTLVFNIKDNAGNIIATKTQVNPQIVNFSFAITDYTRLLSNETITFEIIWGTGSIYSRTGYSLTATNYTLTSQNMFTKNGATGTVVFTPVVPNANSQVIVHGISVNSQYANPSAMIGAALHYSKETGSDIKFGLGTKQGTGISTPSAIYAQLFGRTAGNIEKRAQKLVLATSKTFYGIAVPLYKTGSPTDNATMRIETDSAGSPSGTLADANATASIAGSTLSTSAVTAPNNTFIFAAPVTLSAGTYWFVMGRSGSLSDTNYYNTAEAYYTSSPYGASKYYLSGWQANANYSWYSYYVTDPESGWIDNATINSFTAFGQATAFYVKLVPKAGSLIPLNPAIYGAGVYAE